MIIKNLNCGMQNAEAPNSKILCLGLPKDGSWSMENFEVPFP